MSVRPVRWRACVGKIFTPRCALKSVTKKIDVRLQHIYILRIAFWNSLESSDKGAMVARVQPENAHNGVDGAWNAPVETQRQAPTRSAWTAPYRVQPPDPACDGGVADNLWDAPLACGEMRGTTMISDDIVGDEKPVLVRMHLHSLTGLDPVSETFSADFT